MDVQTAAPAPLTEVSRREPVPADAEPLRGDDYGAFRAVEPGAGTAVAIRVLEEGLRLERDGFHETIAWDHVRSVELVPLRTGPMALGAARIRLVSGPSLDLVRMHVAGAQSLPYSLEPDGAPLLRVERMRLLVASIVGAAGLAATGSGVFTRGERTEPVLDIAVKPRVMPMWAPPALLVLSVLALMYAFNLTLAESIAVTVVLFVHEYGHVIAMKLLNVKVRGVLFLPLLGAATLPEHSFASRWDEARVALAGPMTALPLSVVILAGYRAEVLPREVAYYAFLATIMLNFLNLLPMLPLDGGRAVAAIAAGLPGPLKYLLSFGPTALIALALLFANTGPMVFVVGFFVVFSIVATRVTLRRLAVHQWMMDGKLDLYAVRTALRDITHAIGGRAREDVDGGVPPSPMNVGEIGAVLVVFALEALGILGFGWAAAMIFPDLLEVL